MDNPFEFINQPLREVPPDLKGKVMADIAFAKLIIEMAELFSYNFASIIDTVSKRRGKQTDQDTKTKE